MNIATSFNLPKEFKDYLDTQAKESGSTRTQYVIDAVNAYASQGKTIDQEQIHKIEEVFKKTELLEKDISEIKTIVFQILKNQQG